ncbi:MAG TPA: DegT/DnrJ/EryC1/StrS family aminotransferase [Chloroflexota bacterium]|nr:DegT/DnrJ/EryC1/StrS family aminotransferase [Chloroflexota bacterium]
MNIPLTRPLFGDDERAAVQLPIESGWVVQGPQVKQFEDRFASFVGARHAVATTSCTTALHLAMAAMELTPGDEVIVPAFTWVSTANVVEVMRARPVFCDVDLATFNVDVERVACCVSARTVGVIPVHLFGLCAPMQPILHFARAHHLWVVEDAACGFGAYDGGQHAGTFGDAGCFSFHPRKAITTGEGGMLVTAEDRLDTLARSLRDHGAMATDYERHQSGSVLLSSYPRLGYNYRMTDIQGALGCAQLARADWILSKRRRLAARYDNALRELPWITTPATPDGMVHGYQAYVCLFRPEEPCLNNVERLFNWRNELMRRLEESGVATRQGTHAACFQDYYQGKYRLAPGDFPNAYLAERLTLTLPLYPQMTNEEQDYVVDMLAKCFSSF